MFMKEKVIDKRKFVIEKKEIIRRKITYDKKKDNSTEREIC